MITAIQTGNRRLIREEQELALFHGPNSLVPEGTPTSAAGIWGGHGTGKSSLVDQIDWLASVMRNNGAAWRRSIPIEPNHEPGRDDEETTSCTITTLDDSGEYKYTLTATAERITAEKLWHHPDGPAGNRPYGSLVLARDEHGITNDEVLRQAGAEIKPEDARMPVLASQAADGNPLTQAIRNEIRRITIVHPCENIDGDLELTARAAEVEGPGRSPAGLRRRLVKGLLENLGIELEDLDDAPSRTVREKLATAGDGALRGAAVAVHAAHALTHGGLLVVDPIDSGIHGVWSRQLVDTFRGQPETSLERGQLLFTTGSVDLLTDLPQDQVWLTDRVSPHPAKVESLATFKDVEPTRVRRAYEVGRFGGVPGHTPTALQRARNNRYTQQQANAGRTSSGADGEPANRRTSR